MPDESKKPDEEKDIEKRVDNLGGDQYNWLKGVHEMESRGASLEERAAATAQGRAEMERQRKKMEKEEEKDISDRLSKLGERVNENIEHKDEEGPANENIESSITAEERELPDLNEEVDAYIAAEMTYEKAEKALNQEKKETQKKMDAVARGDNTPSITNPPVIAKKENVTPVENKEQPKEKKPVEDFNPLGTLISFVQQLTDFVKDIGKTFSIGFKISFNDEEAKRKRNKAEDIKNKMGDVEQIMKKVDDTQDKINSLQERVINLEKQKIATWIAEKEDQKIGVKNNSEKIPFEEIRASLKSDIDQIHKEINTLEKDKNKLLEAKKDLTELKSDVVTHTQKADEGRAQKAERNESQSPGLKRP